VTAVTAYTLGELSTLLGLELKGEAATVITGIATLANATAGQLSFYHNNRYYQDLLTTRASVVIVHPKAAQHCQSAVLLSQNPYLSYAKVSSLFGYRMNQEAGIHPTATVHETASVAASAMVAENVVIGRNSRIGEGVFIGANSVIGDSCLIDADSHLAPNVTIYQGVRIGCRVRVHSSVVIGSDGFGFAPDGDKYQKIEQLGAVVIGNDVEIGACSTIDRGALDDTVIEDGVKIDNQVQIAHNVRIGSNSIICGCSAIAGSSVIGKNCIIAGAVGVINHISICDGVTVTAMSLVNKSITEPGVYSSGTGLDKASNWKKNIVRFKQLDEIWKKLLRLEKH